MIYGGDYPDWDYQVDRNSDPTLHSMAHRFPVVYSNPLYGFVIKLATDKITWYHSKIICQLKIYMEPPKVPTPEETRVDTFALLAHHNCHRDRPSLHTMSNSIERDIRAITQITTYVKNNITDYLPRFARKIKTSDTREKRGLGAAAGVILGGSAIANIFS